MNAFKQLVQNRSNAEKTAIILEMMEITVDSRTDVSKKKIIIIIIQHLA